MKRDELETLLGHIGAAAYWEKDKEKGEALAKVRRTMNNFHKQIEELEKELEQTREQVSSILGAKKKYPSYQKFIQLYFGFCKTFIGINPRMSPAQGKAMNDIIEYLVEQSKDKSEEGAILAWQYILNRKNWTRLTKYLQNQTTLIQINKNLQEILTQMRNGSTKASTNKNASSAIKNRIRNRRS